MYLAGWQINKSHVGTGWGEKHAKGARPSPLT
jgi:hypothetical protein